MCPSTLENAREEEAKKEIHFNFGNLPKQQVTTGRKKWYSEYSRMRTLTTTRPY